MTNDTRQRLDELLQLWGTRHQVDDAAKLGLTTRIVARAQTENDPIDSRPECDQRPGDRSRWWSFATAASVIALTIVTFWLTVPWLVPPSGTARLPSEPATDSAVAPSQLADCQFSPTQLTKQRDLFAELQRLFGSQLSWVAQANDQIELGLQSAAGSEPIVPAKPHLVRMVVMRRESSTQSWQEYWKIDFAALDEQTVDCRSNALGHRLQAWVFALPDGKVNCDAHLQLSDDGCEISLSSLQSQGTVAHVTTAQHGNAEYRVYQTIHSLTGAPG